MKKATATPTQAQLRSKLIREKNLLRDVEIRVLYHKLTIKQLEKELYLRGLK